MLRTLPLTLRRINAATQQSDGDVNLTLTIDIDKSHFSVVKCE